MLGMTLFQNEAGIENGELDAKLNSALTNKLITAGADKVKEPHNRTKKLRGWPSERVRKEIYLETMVRETGQPPERAALETWKQKESTKLWETLTKNLSPEWERKILKEHAICHIAKVIANTIHLESMYTTLRPIGERQWTEASKGLRSLADENALHALTEKGNERTKIPDWIKGAILYLSLISSKKVSPMLRRGPSDEIPDPGALKAAAEWCLGTHLKIGGTAQSLEETSKFFEGWQKRRGKMNLHMAQLEIKEIPQESEVPPPTDSEGRILGWNLTWRILPIVEAEIRELGERVLINESALQALGESFKRKTFDRWSNAIAQRGYIRSFEAPRGAGERWMTRMLILNPVDGYISDQIKGETPLRLAAKTEAAWQLITEDLPEPDLI